MTGQLLDRFCCGSIKLAFYRFETIGGRMKIVSAFVILVLVCFSTASAFAQDQSYESEESSISSSLEQSMGSEEAESAENMQEMDTSMQGNETATQTY